MEEINNMQENNHPMACLRCGTCCTMHQAFVTGEDIERISAFLGITPDEWQREYDDPRWRYSQYNLIRHFNGACIFLTYQDGAANCTVQPVKPKCCHDWQPGPDRKECREGLEKAEKKL